MKNIVLTGFGEVTLLDLDTIDLSNLNRQFLFKKKDVKQSKALVGFILQQFRLVGEWMGCFLASCGWVPFVFSHLHGYSATSCGSLHEIYSCLRR